MGLSNLSGDLLVSGTWVLLGVLGFTRNLDYPWSCCPVVIAHFLVSLSL